MFIKKTFDNGVRLVYEKIPYVRSVSAGIWVKAGSRNENEINNGISHYIEHMLFKGTEKRTAKEIAESIESIGGQINAFTGKECTCYYTKTLDTHLTTAMEILADIFFNSKFASADLETERKVILEEINMYEDTPDDLVLDILSGICWKGDPLGFSILGTSESLSGITADMIREYMKQNYTPGNVVVSVAGNFDEARLEELVYNYFGTWNSDGSSSSSPLSNPVFTRGAVFRKKDIEQAHICLGFEGFEQGDDRLYSLLVFNNSFGGTMSSRLFQKIREENGLAYSVYSYPASYNGAGMFGIYAGMSPSQVEKVLSLIIQEINLVKKEGLTEYELMKAKEQLKGNYILGLESTSSRMNGLGKSELLLGYIKTPEQILNEVDAVTVEKVSDTINTVLNTDKISVSLVGKLPRNVTLKKITTMIDDALSV